MKRGRKSTADLSVVRGNFDNPRPMPPGELTKAQASIWRDTVKAMPATWFGIETHPLLIQYCRHTIAAKHVSRLINQAENDPDGLDLSSYDRLLKMQDRETGAINSTATKMRLSQQSSWTAKTSGTAKGNEHGGPKPWESGGLGVRAE